MIDTAIIEPVAAMLARQAISRPDQVAFTDPRQSVTYADLARRTAALAGHLLDLGLGRGERFLMYLDNGIEVAEGYLAAPRAGVVAVCANPTATRPELEYIAENSGARVLVTDSAHLPISLAVANATPQLRTIILTGAGEIPSTPDGIRVVRYDELMTATRSILPPDDTGLDEWSFMLYTSGTTGRPKGVQLTQRGCLWVVAACWIPVTGLGPEDHLLNTLPLFHSYALVLSVLGVTAAGARATLLPKFSPADIESRFAADGVTVFPGVPTMFQYLLNSRAPGDPLKAPDLRICISAGAILSASLNQEFEDYAGVPLLDGYGITETSTMVTMNAAGVPRVPGSCGVPLPGVSLRFVGPMDVDVLPGEEGELWVQGPNVSLGYHELPDATAAAFTDGWYRTGDLGRRDANGFITITGRLKELIIRAGENIAPAEVEDVICRHPSVQDVAVIGAPHPDLGEVPVAFIVPRPGMVLDRDSLIELCRQNLAYFKVPTEIFEIGEIPRTGSGKVRRLELKRTRETSGSHTPA